MAMRRVMRAGVPGLPADPGQFARFRTQMREQPEDIWQPIYDRVNYPAAGTSSLAFYSVAIGGSATLVRFGATAGSGGTIGSVTKTRRDTNLEQGGVIPTKAFKIHGFSLSFAPNDVRTSVSTFVQDMQILLLSGWLDFRILDKNYLYLPLHRIPGSPVLNGAIASTINNATVGFVGNGTGSPRDIYWLQVPMTLDPYQTFTATINFDGSPAISTATDIQLFMEGFLRRPGQ